MPNPDPGRDYEMRCETPEFTCVCPMTGQPDFATVRISYVPDQWIIELKSLKLYLWQYRQDGAFHEAVTNQILDDFIAAVQPRRMTSADRLAGARRHPHRRRGDPPAGPAGQAAGRSGRPSG